MDQDILWACLQKAQLAPSIHNAQPARWRRHRDHLWLAADLAVQLPRADPDRAGIALSCGAALEAFALAAGLHGYAVQADDLWAAHDCQAWPGHRMVARILTTKTDPVPDALADQLEARFTWRAAFKAQTADLFGWTRSDAVLVTDAKTKRWLADLNDAASYAILQRSSFRRELLSWMRLSARHPRSGKDGMDLAALRMDRKTARFVRMGLGPMWPLLQAFGRAKALAAETHASQTAQIMAVFHRPFGESPVLSGRAYLRLWLEATQLGFAGWPMAALTDVPAVRNEIAAHHGLGADRQVVQVIRFGQAAGPMPPRARRPMAEVFKH